MIFWHKNQIDSLFWTLWHICHTESHESQLILRDKFNTFFCILLVPKRIFSSRKSIVNILILHLQTIVKVKWDRWARFVKKCLFSLYLSELHKISNKTLVLWNVSLCEKLQFCVVIVEICGLEYNNYNVMSSWRWPYAFGLVINGLIFSSDTAAAAASTNVMLYKSFFMQKKEEQNK